MESHIWIQAKHSRFSFWISIKNINCVCNIFMIILCVHVCKVGQIAQVARRLATGWTARFDPGCRTGGDFSFLHVQTGPGVHSASYKMSTRRISPEVKATEHRTIPPYLFLVPSTAVVQAVACAPVTQQARVRSPVGTSFLGEVFSGFFLTCKTNVGNL